MALGHNYAAEVLRVSVEGVRYISPENALGLIAFPSFHTVMAVLTIVFTWNLRWLRLPFLLINIAMIPAILIHGSHYAVDVIGGLIIFLISMTIIKKTKYN